MTPLVNPVAGFGGHWASSRWPTKLELLAHHVWPEMWISDAARLLRCHLTSEIAKRRVGSGRLAGSVVLTCSICGTTYERAKRKANPVCPACRPKQEVGRDEWEAWQQHWLETIPSEELEELVDALVVLR